MEGSLYSFIFVSEGYHPIHSFPRSSFSRSPLVAHSLLVAHASRGSLLWRLFGAGTLGYKRVTVEKQELSVTRWRIHRAAALVPLWQGRERLSVWCTFCELCGHTPHSGLGQRADTDLGGGVHRGNCKHYASRENSLPWSAGLLSLVHTRWSSRTTLCGSSSSWKRHARGKASTLSLSLLPRLMPTQQ